MIGKSRLMKGFSLIEIMVVIVIISILTSLAAVTYRSYIVKARRSAVQEELLQYQQQLEEYFSLNHTYGINGAAGAGCAVFTGDTVPSSEGHYNLSCELTSGYKLSAVPIGGQYDSDKECRYMYLFRNGTRGGGESSSSSDANACW
ncbi:MAG: prepilin-type N-terminal cleavage/methylation domain-containing protein [Succinivibrionaceae bacterium]|nr:prepilin-type N-terminal cleavage/methylation domain-containing protein [Succinivibrionaceae bacterium]